MADGSMKRYIEAGPHIVDFGSVLEETRQTPQHLIIENLCELGRMGF